MPKTSFNKHYLLFNGPDYLVFIYLKCKFYTKKTILRN